MIARNCLEVKLDKVLSLKPEDEKKLHPEALKGFSLLRKQIEFGVSLEELSDEDLDMFLTDGEKRDFNSLMGKIGKELSTCINKDGGKLSFVNSNLESDIIIRGRSIVLRI